MNRMVHSATVPEGRLPSEDGQNLPEPDDIADVLVPSGVLFPWGEDLGWPAWLLAGCSRAARAPLPNLIPLRDDIAIMSNLLDKIGPTTLLRSIMYDDHLRLPTAGFELAPNARELVRILGKTVNVQNPHFQILAAETDDGVALHCHCSQPTGSLGRFYEDAMAIATGRSVMLLNPTLSRLGDGAEGRIVVRLRKIGGLDLAALAPRKPIDIVWANERDPRNDRTSVIIPRVVLERANPRHDAEAWRAIQLRLRRVWMDDSSPISIMALRLHIRQALERRQRAPDLDEISRDLQISKRTMNRKLASMGMGYQSLVTEERMRAAQERLSLRQWSVEMVAQSVGYSTAASFGRAFRQHCGVPPAAWRAANAPAEVEWSQEAASPRSQVSRPSPPTASSNEMEAAV